MSSSTQFNPALLEYPPVVIVFSNNKKLSMPREEIIKISSKIYQSGKTYHCTESLDLDMETFLCFAQQKEITKTLTVKEIENLCNIFRWLHR
eukprot:UN14983